MITKYTVTYSDGATADFMSLEDLIAHDGAPELHPDVALNASLNAPAHESTEAPVQDTAEVPAETASESTGEAPSEVEATDEATV